MRHITVRAAAAGVGLMAGAALAAPALAGSVLVMRESTLRATGSGAFGEYDIGDGTGDAGPFADMVDSADGGVGSPQASAQQHSLPGVMPDGSLGGAWAEGWARAWADESDMASGSWAESNFGIVFEVTEADTAFTLTGSLGASGAGWVGVQLTGDQDMPSQHMMVSEEVGPGGDPAASRSISTTGLLEPGTYGLWVMSTADGAPGAGDESLSYYSVNLSLSDAQPAAVPLPPAVWSGMAVLAALGAARRWNRGRR